MEFGIVLLGGIATLTADGDGGATPLLMLHGVGSDKSVWKPQLAALGGERRVIAADYPGYGDSKPIRNATRGDYADALVAMLEQNDMSRVHVCGLSLGGIVALEMAERAPDLVASLVLADSFARHPDGQAIFASSVELAESEGMEVLAEQRIDRLFATPPGGALRRELVATMAAIPVTSYCQGARAVWLADQRAVASRIACPTLVLCGDKDVVTPPALSDELADLIDNAQRRDIAGAGHLSNLEQYDAFNTAVQRFLVRLPENA